MPQETGTVEKDVYQAPKHFKKVGKLLLRAASKGEYAYIKRTDKKLLRRALRSSVLYL